ncbi:uncharacterized protein [Malus domestica]|uniref:uncharacterized protein n=1 Tax=Malus domestica TaxID=3750 RepID=UPI003976E9AB
MAGSGEGELRASIFNGENFDLWQIKMKTIFRSHELWNLVEKDFDTLMKKEEEHTEAKKKMLQEIVVKDARALGIIQGAVSDQIFPRNTTQESAKAPWDILKQEFVGDKQVRFVKLQGLRRDFMYTRMNEDESLSVYIAKLFDLINQMRSYGEDLNAQDVVAILKGYEQRLDRHGESNIERAFASLNIAFKPNRFNGQANNGKYQKNFNSKENSGVIRLIGAIRLSRVIRLLL